MKYLFEKSKWCSAPTAYWSIAYESKRVGADMQYRFDWKVWLPYASSYYNNALSLQLYINSAQKNVTVKGRTTSKGWSYKGTTDWYTVSNKSNGTVPFYVKLYDEATKTVEATSATYNLEVSGVASELGEISNFVIEEGVVIPITKRDSSFKNVLGIKLGDTTIKTVDGIENGTIVTFSESELTTIYKNTTEVKESDFTFILETLSGSTSLGSCEKTAKGTIEEAKPEFTEDDVGYYAKNPDVTSVTGNYLIQNISELVIQVNKKATAKKEASIKHYEIEYAGVTWVVSLTVENPEFNKGLVKSKANNTFKVRAIDSRGFVTEVEKTLWIVPYSYPKIAALGANADILCKRCDDEGNQSDTGTKLFLQATGEWSCTPDETAESGNTARVEIKCDSATSKGEWVNVSEGISPTYITEGDSVIGQYLIDMVVPLPFELNTDVSYVVSIRCRDDVCPVGLSTTRTFKIPTKAITFHLGIGGENAAFGKYCDTSKEKTVEVAEDWTLDALGKVKIKGKTLNNFIHEQGSIRMDGNYWNYEKYSDGIINEWRSVERHVPITHQVGNLYYSDEIRIQLPTNLSFTYHASVYPAQIFEAGGSYTWICGPIVRYGENALVFWVVSTEKSDHPDGCNDIFYIDVKGQVKAIE